MPASQTSRIDWGPFVPPRFREEIAEHISRRVELLRESGLAPELDGEGTGEELFLRLHEAHIGLDDTERERLAGTLGSGRGALAYAERWNKFWYQRRQGWWIYTWLGDYMLARPLWAVAWQLAERAGWEDDAGGSVELLEWVGKQPEGGDAAAAPVSLDPADRNACTELLLRENVLILGGGRVYPHPDIAARVRMNLKQSWELEPYLKDRLVSEQGSRMTVRWSDGRMIELSAGELMCWLADLGDLLVRPERRWWPLALYEIADRIGESNFKRSDLAVLVEADQKELDDFLRAAEYLGILKREPERGYKFSLTIDIRREARRLGQFFEEFPES